MTVSSFLASCIQLYLVDGPSGAAFPARPRFEGVKISDRHTCATGGDGGGCPSPSVQKPIPSPKAKNQGPSKKLGHERENLEIFENIFLIFCGFLSEEMAPMLLKKPCFSFSCFHKNPCFLLQKYGLSPPPFPPSTPPLGEQKVSPPLE